MTFGEFLRNRLADENLSQVARKIGVSRAVLHQWVSGRRTPSLASVESLQRLAAHLNVSLEELLVGRQAERVISTVTFKDEKRHYRIKIERVD